MEGNLFVAQSSNQHWQVDDPVFEITEERGNGIVSYRADHDVVIVDRMRPPRGYGWLSRTVPTPH